jgi:hypothetical protein
MRVLYQCRQPEYCTKERGEFCLVLVISPEVILNNQSMPASAGVVSIVRRGHAGLISFLVGMLRKQSYRPSMRRAPPAGGFIISRDLDIRTI